MGPVFAIASAALAAAHGDGQSALEVRIDGLRTTKGMLRLCLTRNAAHFPDCGGDPAATKISVSAGTDPILVQGLQPGAYAISAIHDENANGKLDSLFGIPREGFGFSNNPTIRFGAPSFNAARFTLTGGEKVETIRMKYLL